MKIKNLLTSLKNTKKVMLFPVKATAVSVPLLTLTMSAHAMPAIGLLPLLLAHGPIGCYYLDKHDYRALCEQESTDDFIFENARVAMPDHCLDLETCVDSAILTITITDNTDLESATQRLDISTYVTLVPLVKNGSSRMSIFNVDSVVDNGFTLSDSSYELGNGFWYSKSISPLHYTYTLNVTYTDGISETLNGSVGNMGSISETYDECGAEGDTAGMIETVNVKNELMNFGF